MILLLQTLKLSLHSLCAPGISNTPHPRIIYVDKNGNGHLYRWHRHCTFTHLMSFYPGAPLSTVVWMPGWNCLLVRYQSLMNVLFSRFVVNCFQIKMVLVEVLPSGGKWDQWLANMLSGSQYPHYCTESTVQLISHWPVGLPDIVKTR